MATMVERQQFSNFSYFTVNINGTKVTVFVTASASIAEQWINNTLSRAADYPPYSRLVVGLSMDPRVDTLHLCFGPRCLIFQLSRADFIPLSLRSFMLNIACTFGGFWNIWHGPMMESSKHGLLMDIGPFDLRWLEEGLENLSVEEMILKCLGFKVEQREDIRTSDWSQEKLSDDQVLYACVESYCAFTIGVNLRMWELC